MIDLKCNINKVNAGMPQCPVALDTLIFPETVVSKNSQQQPYVYLNCGHVQGRHGWNKNKYSSALKCPLCMQLGPVAKLRMGLEPLFYVDHQPMPSLHADMQLQKKQ